MTYTTLTEEVHISNLKYRDIIILTEGIDNGPRDRNWNYIAKLLLEGKKDISQQHIDFLHHGYIEEQSESWQFLQSLSTKLSECSIETFRKVACIHHRMDICRFLDTFNETSMNIWDLTDEKKKELVRILEKPCITIADWRMLADELGYLNHEILNIKSRKRSYEKPSLLLMNILISKYPTMSLNELAQACINASRYDVVETLNIIKNRILNKQ